ncbi:MAG TPA: hypothetical protein VLU43_01040 [Anaeromyxobacteraceae bacterium]|nr:hypothetical protein [Anaeromyxobacteraceae bacterium]
MPVSKKRKKDGKPVRREQPAPHAAEGHPESHATPQELRVGQPKNPFVTAQQQMKRGAQRGR